MVRRSPMGFEIDLLQRAAFGANMHLAALLQRHGVASSLVGRVQEVLLPIEFIFLVFVVAAGAARIDREWCGRRADGMATWLLAGAHAAAGLYALRLLYWVYLHPSSEAQAVVGRWDFLVAAILGGLVLRRAPSAVRHWALVVLSVLLLRFYVGEAAFDVVAGACLIGFAATRWRPTDRGWVRIAVHAALMAGVFAWLWSLRDTRAFDALRGWGLYSFVLFRHVSFVVEHAHGMPSTLGGYLCYLLFFPNCMGAMEVYDEFWNRNLAGLRPPEFLRAARTVVAGTMCLWLALHIDVTEDRVAESVGFAAMWGNLVVLFFRAVLGSMGIWGTVEGAALFLGYELRPNFRYVLTATTPSQFWRAWRATMTNWLIHYVYIPLGGNRRHQTFNVFGAFLVSTAWHVVGVLYLLPATWTASDVGAVGLWGAVNFAGVASHAQWRRRWPPREYAGPWRMLVLAGKWALAMLFGTSTVLLLGLSVGRGRYLGHVVRTLLGLEGW